MACSRVMTMSSGTVLLLPRLLLRLHLPVHRQVEMGELRGALALGDLLPAAAALVVDVEGVPLVLDPDGRAGLALPVHGPVLGAGGSDDDGDLLRLRFLSVPV